MSAGLCDGVVGGQPICVSLKRHMLAAKGLLVCLTQHEVPCLAVKECQYFSVVLAMLYWVTILTGNCCAGKFTDCLYDGSTAQTLLDMSIRC